MEDMNPKDKPESPLPDVQSYTSTEEVKKELSLCKQPVETLTKLTVLAIACL